jgi:thioredoxin reductase
MDEKYDVVIVGGGAAGLSAALTLARSRRTVLVVDAGAPRNAPAGHVHNYLGREGTPPASLLEAGRAEVASYGGSVVTGTVASAEPVDGGFRVLLDDGRSVRARRLLVATGLVDELPDVPGLAERWGRDVVHCPYCHGWEVRDQAIGVLASGPFAVHQALLFRQLSADVVLFQHTLGAIEDERLAARGIAVVEGEVVGLEVTGDRLTGVRLRSGEVVPRQALAVQPRYAARASFGLPSTDVAMNGHVIGSAVAADPTGATAVPGMWVAGDVANLRGTVIGAAAAGVSAATAINADLVEEDALSATI